MKTKPWQTAILLAFLLAAPLILFATVENDPLETAATNADLASAVDPASYPAIGREELGQLRWSLQLADQALDDYSNMEGLDQFGMTSYRYLIAFTAYFLAVEQHHKLPACREIIQPRLDRLIQKMIEKPVWEFWAGESIGVFTLEPNFDTPYPEQPDPVAYRNIMYSGHLAHMIGLYETLYRDFKWEQPGSIVFEWSPSEKFVYDYHSLNQVLFGQMTNNPAHCIECEPNACFPECNQHPVLSFLLYDKLHGTDLMSASEPFMDFFLQKKMIHPQTHQTAILYLVKQDLTVSQSTPVYKNPMDLVVAPAVTLGLAKLASASADGWTGAFMHAWQKDYIGRHYPYQRENNLQALGRENARLASTAWEPQLKYGFFAMYAAEMGDPATRDQLLNFADKRYAQEWRDGTMRYPYNPGRGCTNLTGVLLAIARALPPDGMWDLHNRAFDDALFSEPTVTGVDFPRLVLTRAVFDRARQALVVSTAPGTGQGGSSTFTVAGLDPAASYSLTVDGNKIDSVQGRDSVAVTANLDGPHDYVLRKE